jgi:hypothetical protein
MRDHVLCNLVFDDDGFLGEHPDLILRARPGSVVYDASSKLLELNGDVDFTTYLNALSIGKWRTYASVQSAYLRLETRGGAYDVYGTSLAEGAREPIRSSHPLVHVAASDGWRSTEFVIPVPDDAPIVSFAIVSKEPVQLKGGCWYTHVNEQRLNDVRLAIATTTFRKESYVTRNVEALRSVLFDGKDEPCDRFHLFVVDNGRTLDAAALSDANVTVIPNPNVG